METGEEARLASQLMELPLDASVSFLKRRLERISFGGHQLASSQQVCTAQSVYDATDKPRHRHLTGFWLQGLSTCGLSVSVRLE